MSETDGLGDGVFRALADASAAITFIYQGEQILYANPVAIRATGYSLAELRTSKFWDVIHPDSQALIRARGLARQRGEPVPATYEVKLLRKGGDVLWLDFTAAMVEIGGKPAVLGTAFDVTERRRAELALAASEANYRRLFDNPFLGVLQATRAGKVLLANRATLDLLGFATLEEFQREGILSAYAVPADRDRLLERLAAEGRIDHMEMEFRRRTGEVVRAEIRVALEGDLVTGVLLDVTERRRLEHEALRAQRLESLGIVAGGIAHDFNNFLCAILGNVSLARFHARPGDPSAEWLEQAEQACQRAKGLTQQLLTFARGGAPSTKRVVVRSLLEEAVGFGLRGSSVACDWALEPDLPLVEADEGQIAQVVHNLVLNAVQAMAGGGTLRVGAQRVRGADGDRVRLSFQDTGPGIPPAEQARIFDPYYTTKPTGVGLGLATAHSIIERHGARLRVESSPPDGARFVFDLPVAAAQERSGEGGPAQEPPHGAGRVLLMDDEEPIRLSTGAILRQLGYEVRLACDGDEAVAAYERARDEGRAFHLVLLDLTIRGGPGGLEALERLRSLDPGVRAVVVSGYATDPALAKYDEFGFVGRLQKPFTLAELAGCVRRCLTTTSKR